MPKLDFTKKFNAILHDPSAQTVFMIMHQSFPRAGWSNDVPKLGKPAPNEDGLAEWWDKKFKYLVNLSDPAAAKAVKEAEPSRNKIGEYLDKMSSQFASGDKNWKGTALQMSQEFKTLIGTIRDAMPAPDEDSTKSWTSFQDASASLLLRVSAYLSSSDPSVGPRSEATLKLAEETQRLLEIVGEPPDDLKITAKEKAATYLQQGIPIKPGSNEAKKQGAQITGRVINTFLHEKLPGKLNYLENLANEVKDCRELLVSQAAEKPPKFDKDNAVRAIMIAEAMTPEYTSRPALELQDQKRNPFKPEKVQQLKDSVNEDFEDRLKEEVKEKGGEGEIL